MIQTGEDRALYHLGAVLQILANITPGDQCKGYDEALAFYNATHPDARIEPSDDYVTHLLTIGPFDCVELQQGILTDRMKVMLTILERDRGYREAQDRLHGWLLGIKKTTEEANSN